MNNANRNLKFAPVPAIAVALLLFPSRVGATNDETHLSEVMAGANGNSKIQFIVIRQEGGGNSWGPDRLPGQSEMMLQFFDATGRETGRFKFPHDAPGPAAADVLIATQDFANLPGAPAPDFIIPPLLNAISGKLCFTNNPLGSNAFLRTDCLSYGNFTGDTGSSIGGATTVVFGPPAAALPIVNTVSLRRPNSEAAFGSTVNLNFLINTVPTPINGAGATFTIPPASQIAQGATLFTSESFLGNGRSCGSCHIASASFSLPPSNIQSRFATLSATFDPLFVAETNPSSFDAGFDFNLNTLVLTEAIADPLPCSGTLTGIITSAGGAKAKVLTQISPTTYLVYGGMNPQLSGTVSDSHSCSGSFQGITAGSLGATVNSGVLGLEDPKRMRTSADTVNFPQGRGLILENIDGFPPTPPVFRKSPHLLNLDQRTGPFGLSGCCADLQSFATTAVKQHFPRTLARNSEGSAPDFRLPTPDELAAMEAFMRTQTFPAGTDPDRFNLDRFTITAAQQRGRDAFFGAAKCSQCHGGSVLAETTVSILGKPIGRTATFNTGVVNQSINSVAVDNLPCEPSTVSVGACGSREFSVRQLFNVANLAPFFHDASSATLRDAVLFYNSSFFNTSPAGMAIGGINITAIGPTAADDITAFLEGISFSPFTPTFGPVGTVVTITGTAFTGATAVEFNGVAATSFTVVSDTSITAAVPAGATTGPIVVTTPVSTPLMSTTRFTVVPAITSFTPASGPVGKVVTTTGTSFARATGIRFNGVPARSFSVVSDTSITATVPTEATTGRITVTTPDGTATSATNFIVSAPTTTTVTAEADRATAGQAVMFTATVSTEARSNGTPTGVVTFRDDDTALGTGSLNALGVATFASSSLAVGSHSIIAAYGGDASFLPSTSAALSFSVTDFELATTPGQTTRTVNAGSPDATYPVEVVPLNGFTGAVNLTCSLPAAATATNCTVNPASVVTSGDATVTVTTSPTAKMAARSLLPPGGFRWSVGPGPKTVLSALLAMLPLSLCALFARPRRQRSAFVAAQALSILLLVFQSVGCGSTAPRRTPAGTYIVTVTGTSGSLTRTATLTLIVN